MNSILATTLVSLVVVIAQTIAYTLRSRLVKQTAADLSTTPAKPA